MNAKQPVPTRSLVVGDINDKPKAPRRFIVPDVDDGPEMAMDAANPRIGYVTNRDGTHSAVCW